MIEEIITEDDYHKALKRFLDICKNPNDSDEIKEMYVLMDLMGKYEQDNCSIN